MLDPHSAIEHAARASRWADEAGQPMLKAQALRLRAFSFRPQIEPLVALEACRQAREIFEGHELEREAGSCRARECVAMSDAGLDQAAIALGTELLAGMLLENNDRAATAAAMALSELHLGRLLRAWQLLVETAEPAALAGGCERMQARVHHIQAQVLLGVAFRRESAGLWLVEGVAHFPVPAPQLRGMALEVLDRAQRVAGDNGLWGHFVLTRLMATSVLQADARGVDELRALATAGLANDSALAVHALIGLALLLRRCGRMEEALAAGLQAQHVATTTGQTGALRDVMLLVWNANTALGRDADASVALAEHARLLAAAIGQGDGEQARAPPLAVSQPLGPRLTVLPGFLKRAVRFIDTHASGGLRVQDIAQHCEVSRRTLETAFVRHRGTTVAAYVTRVTMDRASQRLRLTGWPLQRVAQDAGYRSPAAFARAFKAVVGLPPAAWRRQHGADHNG